MLFAGIVFVVSLLGIAVLFGMKSWELSRQRVLFPELRRRGDVRALQVKDLALAARADLSKLPPHIVAMTHVGIHDAARALARFARYLERQLHRLADMVSHKRGFERRETSSEFLKKVAEHKSGGLDTTESNGHNS